MAEEDRRLYGQPSGSQDPSALQTGPEAAQGSLARILAESQAPKSAVSETSPLLPRASSRSRVRRRRASVSHGDATVGQAVLMVCPWFITITWGSVPTFFFVALEVVRRDWGFVFGESVSSNAFYAFVRCLITLRQLSQRGSFVFDSDAFGHCYHLPVLVFTSCKDQVCCIGEFWRYVCVRGNVHATFLTDFRPGRDALWSMDAIFDSHVHHNITDRLCRRIYDIRRGELAKLCLRCFGLHIAHPSPISHSHATRYIPPHGTYPKSGKA